MSRTPSGLRAALIVFVACLVGATACGGGGAEGDPTADGPPASTTSSTTTTSTTTTVPDGPRAPLTGVVVDDGSPLERPALVVKVDDNDERARPQAGLAVADVVFEELIEGQKTRLAAVYHSVVPDRVGPVRSGRTSDIDILAALGSPLFAYSGANTTVMGQLARAARAGTFVDVNALDVVDAYERDESRRAPDNLYLHPDRLPDPGPAASAPGPLFAIDTDPAPEGPGGGIEVAYPASFGRRSTHVWDPDRGGWVRIQDGTLHVSEEGPDAELTEIAPANVVVAVVGYTRSDADAVSPQAHTVGEGPALIATRGEIVEGRWSRPTATDPWEFTGSDGGTVPLAPGSTWILLANGDRGPFPAAAVRVLDPGEASATLASARAAS